MGCRPLTLQGEESSTEWASLAFLIQQRPSWGSPKLPVPTDSRARGGDCMAQRRRHLWDSGESMGHLLLEGGCSASLAPLFQQVRVLLVGTPLAFLQCLLSTVPPARSGAQDLPGGFAESQEELA